MTLSTIVRPAAVVFVTFVSLAPRPVPQPGTAPRTLTAASISGSWMATLSHADETRPLGVTLEAVDDHTVSVKMSNPALHIDDLPIGKATIDGNAVSLGPGFALQYDAASDTLHCTLPADLVPLYAIEATFHRGHVPPQAARSLGGDPAMPVWTFDAGAPIWADVAASDGLVYAGTDAGRLHAIDAASGRERWAFTAGELISTMADLRTWVVSYATGSLVSPEMQKERLTWMTLPPNTPERAYGIGIGIDHGWLGHTGELPGYNCSAFYLPDKQAVIVVMVNSDIPVGKNNPSPTIMKALTQVVTPGNVPQ